MSNLKRIICGLGGVMSLQVIGWIFLAILVYPGGFSLIHSSSVDLLAPTNMNEQPNHLSPLIFLCSLIIFGVFTLPMWLVIPTPFTKTMRETGLSTLGSVLGLMGTVIILKAIVAFINKTGYGDLPYYVLFFTLSFFVYSLAILYNPEISNNYSLSGLVMMGVVIVYISTAMELRLLGNLLFFWVIINENILIYCVWPELRPARSRGTLKTENIT
ncbi:MAG: hypothetical protein ACFFC6_05655 [Promethearchaeota archaeon]